MDMEPGSRRARYLPRVSTHTGAQSTGQPHSSGGSRERATLGSPEEEPDARCQAQSVCSRRGLPVCT